MASDGTAFGILEKSHRLHQELLARRLAAAKSQHDAALAELRQAIDANHGWREILEARFVEADALSEYIAALQAIAGMETGSGVAVA